MLHELPSGRVDDSLMPRSKEVVYGRLDGFSVNEQIFKLPSLGMTQNSRVNASGPKKPLKEATIRKGTEGYRINLP